jgi:hypothetical protein
MLKDLSAGEVVTVTRIDRLPRSTFDLFAIVKRIDGGQIPLTGGAVGRHVYQHRALVDCRPRRPRSTRHHPCLITEKQPQRLGSDRTPAKAGKNGGPGTNGLIQNRDWLPL